MSTLKVDGIRSNSATSDAITLADNGTCTANITNNLSNRNLIINGAMQVAQRGTSGTGYGYIAVDRFRIGASQVDENPTTAQVDVASGTTPYTNGFTKAIKITNGNQTGGAGTGDSMNFTYRLEAQDIRNSGWNYLSSSSYITLSFWCKSSVAQTFFGRLYTTDGTAYNYPFSMGSLSADTWTKITKTIPGNSNLTFDNNADQGLAIEFTMFNGTAKTDSGVALDTWAAYNTATRQPDNTSTWYTTNDSTWELTGVQLEVGSVATDFEHRSFAQELALCQRYYEIGVHGNYGHVAGSGTHKFYSQFKTQKRTGPTLAIISSQENYVSSVNITADPMDNTLGCRIQGAVVVTGDNKYIDAKFSSDAEL